ncbi:MAG: helix-turn-helix transcriptional regulator [Pararhizobium sp.]
MASPTPAGRQRELGDFVRACRERLAPAALGLPAGMRRRTPGLRREEVAQLAGLSTTWYTWLEQGREVSVSPAAVGRLAATLQLSRAERAYLFEMAGKRDPAAAQGPAAALPQVARDCVDAIAAPAYILDRTWNALAWNAAAEALFVGWLDGDNDRNLLRYILLSETAHRLIRDVEARIRRNVAEFRADVSRRLDDPDVIRLIGELQAESPLFASLWAEHAVLSRDGGRREFDHPRDGFLVYEQATFTLAGQPDVKLTMLLRQAA